MNADLRDLAAQLLELTRAHPCSSQAMAVVQNAADHLNCMAYSQESRLEVLKANNAVGEALLARIKDRERIAELEKNVELVMEHDSNLIDYLKGWK